MRILGSLLTLGHKCPIFLAVPGGILRTPRAMIDGRHCYGTESGDNSRPISRYPIPNIKDLPSDILKIFEEAKKPVGYLPNFFKAMAHRPNELRYIYTYFDFLLNKKTGNLSLADKELVIVATSAYNRCPYCVTTHAAMHRLHSKNPILAYQVVVNWDFAELSQRDHAMLEFALKIAKPEKITDVHFQKLEEHGFDREDAWDIAMLTAFSAMANRIAYFLDLRPNVEYFTLGRGHK
uniref:DDB1 and CUL4 associated factor 10 n=1 Tax=Leptobrachium leishanense TaxID=445787 RepID=A0A8C5M1F4_9ANUR